MLIGGDIAKGPRAGLASEQDDAHEHGQPAQRGDHQCLLRGAAGRGTLCVVADQEVGQHGGNLPEHVHQQEIIRGHQAKHGGGKAHHLRGEHGQAAARAVKIAPAIHQHQRAHAQDDEAK